MVTIEGPGWEDFQDMELPRPPSEGEPLETQYGKCIVTKVDPYPGSESYSGKIVCRLP